MLTVKGIEYPPDDTCARQLGAVLQWVQLLYDTLMLILYVPAGLPPAGNLKFEVNVKFVVSPKNTEILHCFCTTIL